MQSQNSSLASLRPLALALGVVFGLILLAGPWVAWAEEALDPLVGTWTVQVSSPDGAPFQALQTFHADGSFTETSDLLATLTEGPAHGVWVRDGDVYRLTFLLFAFDGERSPVGRIRVRAEVHYSPDRPGRFTADYQVDFLGNDGTTLNGIGTGSGTARRLRVQALD